MRLSLPESGANLASQPTISRMENAATIGSCHRIAQLLFDVYLSQREKGGAAPEKVLLDFDATDDPTHGSRTDLTTTATTESICTILCSTSMARVGIS